MFAPPIVNVVERFDDSNLEAFLAMRSDHVCRLCLRNAALGPRGALQLAERLRQMKSLSVFLYETDEGEEVVYPLLDALCVDIISVHVGASWTNDGQGLREALSRFDSANRTVAVRGRMPKDLDRFMGNLPVYTRFRANGCTLSDETAVAIAGAVRAWCVISLDLSGTAVTPPDLAKICAGLAERRAEVTRLDLSGTGVGEAAFRQVATTGLEYPLRCLQLRGIQLDASAMDALIEWVDCMPCMWTVELSMNRTDPFWIASLARLAAHVQKFVYVHAPNIPWDAPDQEFLACHVAAAGGQAEIHVEAAALHTTHPWSRHRESPATYTRRLRMDARLYHRVGESGLMPAELLLPAVLDASGFPEAMLRRTAHILEN